MNSIDKLRWHARQGDLEALQELLVQLRRRNSWNMNRNVASALHEAALLYHQNMLSYPHYVELVNQLVVGVPLTLVAIYFFECTWVRGDTYPHEFAERNQLPRPRREGDADVIRLSRKRGIYICYPEKVVDWLDRESYINPSSPIGTCYQEDVDELPNPSCPSRVFEFIPEKGCTKTRTRVGRSMSGARARYNRQGCWEWDGSKWTVRNA